MLAGASSRIGEVHHELTQPNQDNFLINPEKNIFAVFDGHGDQGHLIASYLRENLAKIFSDSPKSSVEDSLKITFQTVDKNICSSTNSESSGSTCVMAHFDHDTLYVAGVGDCSALLVKANTKDPADFEVTPLHSPHKLTSKAEHDRITATGAHVAGDYIVCRNDPNKVINMTRAFGDQDMKTSGVISIPDITATKMPHTKSKHSEDTFLLLFSDGLEQVASDTLIAKEAYKIIKDNISKGDVNSVCASLLQGLEDLVFERDGFGFSDDATIVAVVISGFSH